jgi:hypothetical protein
MRKSDGTFCPYIQEDCIEFKCKFFQKIQGSDPQTGQNVDEYDCAILWNNILLIENSQMQRQTGAAVESFRNKVVDQNEKLLTVQTSDVLLINKKEGT